MIQRRASDKFDGEQELSEHSHFLEAIFDIAPKDSRKSNSISCYQTCIMIMTVTAISAVDFRAFPPNFRKTHAFGLSLVRFLFYHEMLKFIDGYWCGIDHLRKWFGNGQVFAWTDPVDNAKSRENDVALAGIRLVSWNSGAVKYRC